jgi:hypothetical protein
MPLPTNTLLLVIVGNPVPPRATTTYQLIRSRIQSGHCASHP